MLRASHAGISLVAFVLICLLLGVVMTWLPPSPRDAAHDSFSGKPVGHRAVLELLSAFGLDVQRHLDPPADLVAATDRVLIIEPSLARLEREHDYLSKLASHVHDGGELLVVTNRFERLLYEKPQRPTDHRPEKDEKKSLTAILYEDRFLSTFGISALSTTEEKTAEEENDYWRPATRDMSEERYGPRGAVVLSSGRLTESKEFRVRSTGSLADITDGLETLTLPVHGGFFFEGDSIELATGRIEILLDPDKQDWRPVVLQYVVGEGRLTLASCTRPFMNGALAQSDNAPFVFRLAKGDGTHRIVVDEFYHAKVHEGNWLALAGMYPYSVILLLVLAAVLCRLWTQAVSFGPPLPETVPSRRSISEYIDAMGRLFLRGRKARFVLQTNRAGCIDDLRERLHLPLATPEEQVMHLYHQVAPDAADRLADTLARVDNALSSDKSITVRQTVYFQEELEACQNTRITQPAL